jgi:hypothetical protein
MEAIQLRLHARELSVLILLSEPAEKSMFPQRLTPINRYIRRGVLFGMTFESVDFPASLFMKGLLKQQSGSCSGFTCSFKQRVRFCDVWDLMLHCWKPSRGEAKSKIGAWQTLLRYNNTTQSTSNSDGNGKCTPQLPLPEVVITAPCYILQKLKTDVLHMFVWLKNVPM